MLEIDAGASTISPAVLDRLVTMWQYKTQKPTFHGLSFRFSEQQYQSYVATGYALSVGQDLLRSHIGLECAVDSDVPHNEVQLCLNGQVVARLTNLDEESDDG